MMHKNGLNVRHLGMLRVILGGDAAEASRGASSSGYMPVQVRRYRAMMLNDMITRVLKHLLREAMRGMAERANAATLDPADAGAAVTATAAGAASRPAAPSAPGDDAAADAEEPRVQLVRACLNRALALRGVWSDTAAQEAWTRKKARGRGGAASGGAAAAGTLVRADSTDGGDSDVVAQLNSDVLWATVIRTHTQLKFGAQLPALAPFEVRSAAAAAACTPCTLFFCTCDMRIVCLLPAFSPTACS